MAIELQIPKEIAEDETAREIARVWVTDDVQKIIVRTDAWDDPAAWGILLVDLAQQIARGHVEARGGVREDVLARIKEGFDAEWMFSTDQELEE
jgi:hypothetical protein